VCERERERERERESVCVYVCVSERGIESVVCVCVYVCVSERESVCVSGKKYMKIFCKESKGFLNSYL